MSTNRLYNPQLGDRGNKTRQKSMRQDSSHVLAFRCFNIQLVLAFERDYLIYFAHFSGYELQDRIYVYKKGEKFAGQLAFWSHIWIEKFPESYL